MINCCSNNLQVCTSLEKWHTAQLMPPGIFGLDYTLPLLFLLLSCSVVSDSLQPHELQHARLPCLSLSPGVCSNSCPLSWCCHPTISSTVIPFSSCPQSFPASESFPVSWLFASGGPSSRDSASVLPMNIQGWLPLGLTDLTSLQSKGLHITSLKTLSSSMSHCKVLIRRLKHKNFRGTQFST